MYTQGWIIALFYQSTIRALDCFGPSSGQGVCTGLLTFHCIGALIDVNHLQLSPSYKVINALLAWMAGEGFPFTPEIVKIGNPFQRMSLLQLLSKLASIDKSRWKWTSFLFFKTLGLFSHVAWIVIRLTQVSEQCQIFLKLQDWGVH